MRTSAAKDSDSRLNSGIYKSEQNILPVFLGRPRQISLATAEKYFTKPGAHHLVHLSTSAFLSDLTAHGGSGLGHQNFVIRCEVRGHLHQVQDLRGDHRRCVCVDDLKVKALMKLRYDREFP